jgi:trehalose 6-phosphate synthase
MPAAAQRDRMHSMRHIVSEWNVYRWAGSMLVDAAGVRRRDRLSARSSTPTRRGSSDPTGGRP